MYMRYTKFLFILLGASLFSTKGYSQNNLHARDSLLKLMSVQVCDEMNKANLTDLSPASLENALMMSMIPVITQHQSALEQVLDVNVSDPQSFEKFGNALGIELLRSCAVFRDAAIAGSVESKSESTPSDTKTVSGKLLKVQTGGMNSIELMNADGGVLTIWCTRHFSGDEKLSDMNHVGKHIQVEYVTEKVYDFIIGNYREIMVARGISGL